MPLVYASRNISRCPLQDSRPGWIRYFLSCGALASPTTCRFIPAHDVKRPTRGWGAPKARLRHTSTRSRLFAQVDCWTLGRFSFPIRPDLPEVDMWEDRPKLRPRDARFKDLFHCLLSVFTTACSVLPLSWA